MKPGDYIQWECNGAFVFEHPCRVKELSECGQFLFVEGSGTGIPISQAILVTDFNKPGHETFTFFWRESEVPYGVFSQWYGCKFVLDKVVYNCAEQYMMASKARLFGDVAVLKKIMQTSSPRTQKSLGRDVRGFDEATWNSVAKDVVYRGNHAKFTQNKQLLEILLSSQGTLVEASPYDRVWGIGLAENDLRVKNRSAWQGTNWLGEVLTMIRDDLKNLRILAGEPL